MFSRAMMLHLIKYLKEINNVRYLKFHAPITNNKTPRYNAITIFNYVKRQSIGETLRDEQKAPLFPNGIIVFVST